MLVGCASGRSPRCARRVSLARPVGAAHANGWYVGLEGGANWIDDVDTVTSVGGEPATPDTVAFEGGWALLGTIGYAFAGRWRLEGEAGYRSNETTGGLADVDEWSLMINALYDIEISPRAALSLGAGAGYDSATLDVDGAGEDEDGNFAYQGIAALSYAVTPAVDLTLTYRYLHVPEPEFDIGGGALTATLDDVAKHALTVGLRFDLSPAAPPPPPASPPPPPPPPPVMITEPFIIFFGFGKCSVTSEADRVLSEAAAAAKSSRPAAVVIVGHSDSAGSASANQKLSECRANAAKANLVAKGVAEGMIATSGKGESEPMVQTDDGVKEPQNRRVTINFK